jgi:hypothetical protein
MVAGALLVAIGLAGLLMVRPGTGFLTYAWALILLGAGIPEVWANNRSKAEPCRLRAE